MRHDKRRTGFFSAIFAFLALCIAGAGIYLALANADAQPVLVKQPEAARNRVQTMMDALVAGEYDTVSGCLYGSPDLGLGREADGEVGKLFWNALRESFSWEMQGDFYATDSGVALNVVISALDLDSVSANLRSRAQNLLEQRVAQAEDPSEIYDENNDYREEFVMDVLQDAAQEALEQDAQRESWNLILNLIYENGQWWIMPESGLLTAISGGVLG